MRSIKLMLLGITFILVAIYISQVAAFRTDGWEFVVLVFGLIFVIIGFFIDGVFK